MAKKATTTQIASDPFMWDFPSTGGGEEHGFADSQLEHFQGDHEKYIARETIQDAVDVRVDYSKPVTVRFERFDIPVAELPGAEMLKDRIGRCLEFVKNQEKAEKFFKNASELLNGKKITVLKISDFNTKGLSGSDDDREGGWYRLVRAAGTSSPKGVRGGSFGIGKGAPIAASALRTVFYSTINEKGETAFQGKARLVSHYGDEKDVRQGVGFCGLAPNGRLAVRNSNDIPEIFRRAEQGTDISSLALKAQGNAPFTEVVLDHKTGAVYGTEEGEVILIGEGETIELTVGAATMTCNPVPNDEMAPFNWGNEREGSPADTDL